MGLAAEVKPREPRGPLKNETSGKQRGPARTATKTTRLDNFVQPATWRKLSACRAGTRAGSCPEHLHQQAAIKIPKPPPARLGRGNNTAKIRQKTRESDAFLPTANPPASKKVIENKDTMG